MALTVIMEKKKLSWLHGRNIKVIVNIIMDCKMIKGNDYVRIM